MGSSQESNLTKVLLEIEAEYDMSEKFSEKNSSNQADIDVQGRGIDEIAS